MRLKLSGPLVVLIRTDTSRPVEKLLTGILLSEGWGLGQRYAATGDLDGSTALDVDEELLDDRQVLHLDVRLHVAERDAVLRVVRCVDFHAVRDGAGGVADHALRLQRVEERPQRAERLLLDTQ